MLHRLPKSIHRNRFLDSINLYKYELCVGGGGTGAVVGGGGVHLYKEVKTAPSGALGGQS